MYLGEFNSSGQREGLGRLLWADGTYYEGELKQNMMEGEGRMVQTMLGVYQGQWKNSKAHGKGVLTKPGKINKME